MKKSYDSKSKKRKDIKALSNMLHDKFPISDINKAVRLWKNVSYFNIHKMTNNHLSLLLYKPVIYFLLKEKEVVYVGETKSLVNRLSQHVNEGLKDFDQIRFIEFNGTDSERKEKERQEIIFHKPLYNKIHNK